MTRAAIAQGGVRYFANLGIGTHSRNCFVHPDFRVVVIVARSELPNVPRPFMNRFERYVVSPQHLLDAALLRCSDGVREDVRAVRFAAEVHHSCFAVCLLSRLTVVE